MAQTKEQHREWMRQRRALQRAQRAGQLPPDPVTGQPAAAGGAEGHRSVVDAVLVELAAMPAAGSFPAVCETARVLAQLLDDPLQKRHHPSAATALRSALAEVRGAQVADSARSSLRAIRGEVAG